LATNIVDLLTDLRHLCEKEKIDLESLLRISKETHEEEAAEETGG
jgi:hypothetical protein